MKGSCFSPFIGARNGRANRSKWILLIISLDLGKLGAGHYRFYLALFSRFVVPMSPIKYSRAAASPIRTLGRVPTVVQVVHSSSAKYTTIISSSPYISKILKALAWTAALKVEWMPFDGTLRRYGVWTATLLKNVTRFSCKFETVTSGLVTSSDPVWHLPGIVTLELPGMHFCWWYLSQGSQGTKNSWSS